ncbi:MAG: hypothetical protein MJZ61_00820 [Bacteroidales bacterium]|nr:hypothetical protein [Bacteroidales bacterium]
MKRHILPIAGLALLCGCGGGSSTQNGDNAGSTQNATETSLQAAELSDAEVQELYKQIPDKDKMNPDAKIKMELVGTRHYAGAMPRADYEDEDYSENLHLLPRKDGSWLVLFSCSSCWDGCSRSYIFYDYKDGKLSKSNMELPSEPMEYYVEDKFLLYGYEGDRKAKIEENLCEYYMTGPDTLNCSIVLPSSTDDLYFNSFNTAQYVWDGEQFQKAGLKEFDDRYAIIWDEKLGNVRLGEKRPEQIEGFQISKIGQKWFYNRDGKKIFSIKADSDNNVEEIEVYYDKYADSFYGIGDSIQQLIACRSSIINNQDGKRSVIWYAPTRTNVEEFIGDEKGIIQSIKIYKHPDWVNLISGLLYEMIVDKYSAFESDKDEPGYEFGETEGVITESRRGGNINETFKMVYKNVNTVNAGIFHYIKENGDIVEQGVEVYMLLLGKAELYKEMKFPTIDRICEDFLVDKNSLTQPTPDYELNNDGSVKVKLHTNIGDTEYTYKAVDDKWVMED